MLLNRCGSQPERKTFVVSTCCGIGLLSCPLFLLSVPAPLVRKSHPQRSVRGGPKPHLPRAPSGHGIAPDPGKVCERKSQRAWSRRESASPGAPSEGRPRPAWHSLPLSHHGLCVLPRRGFRTPICFPISSLRLYNKRFLFTKTVVIRPRANRMWNRRWLHAREILF